MLTVQKALERASRIRTETRDWRRYHSCVWAINLAYARGKQWIRSGRSSGSGRGFDLYGLEEIIDPRRQDVRVTMDIIGQNMRRTEAALKPLKLIPQVMARPGVQESTVMRGLYERLMIEQLPKINALQIFRDMTKPRLAFGTCLIKRQISMNGRPVMLGKDSRKTGKPLSLRDLNLSWARVFPYKILRSPATRDIDPNVNESEYGYEEPRTVNWIKRNFGIEVETQSKLGQLLRFQDELTRATGWGDRHAAGHAQESSEPAVMIYEFYFQDKDMPAPWPWQLLAYIDPNNLEKTHDLRPLHFGPSPFFGLPFSAFHYRQPVHGPWGEGLPQLNKQVQDIVNLTVTNKLRMQLDHGLPKWLIEKGTIESPEKQLSNRSDAWIEWQGIRPNSSKPERIRPVGGDAGADNFLDQVLGAAREQVSLADVQFGAQVPRGQSGDAYREVGQQADAVLNDIQKDDELTLNELLYGTLIDTVKLLKTRPRKARKLLGADFSKYQISKAMSANPIQMVREVRILPESLRPKTPRQTRDNFTDAVVKNVLEPKDAVWEMQRQSGVTMDTTMRKAMDKQAVEIEMLIAGEDVQVTGLEEHTTAGKMLREFMSSTAWMNLTDEQMTRIEEHAAAHKMAAIELSLIDAQGVEAAQPTAQGSPPREGAAPPETVPLEAVA